MVAVLSYNQTRFDEVIKPSTNLGEDEGRETTSLKDPSSREYQVPTKSLGQSTFNPPEKSHEPCSGLTKTKSKCSSPTTTWNTFLAPLEYTSKWNQFNLISQKKVMANTRWTDLNLLELDMRALRRGFLLDQEEPSYEVTCSVILTQQGISESWNQVKSYSESEVMMFTTQSILDKPYLEPCGFNRLQTYLWRPGMFVIHLEACKDVSPCTNITSIHAQTFKIQVFNT